MSERKLAHIEKIIALDPIEGADKIEKATILGWALVVKKGDFSVGDWCVYVEIDSILPEKPEFEFLRNRKFRIRTIKLRKQVSQGIAFPLLILPKKVKPREGLDVTEILGITKHDPEAPKEVKKPRGPIVRFLMRFKWFRKIMLKKRGTAPFPGFIFKTDEERIQNMPWVIGKHKEKIFYVTEKLDGTSVTYFIKDGKFGVCSRNLQLLTKDKKYWDVAEAYEIPKKMKILDNVAIQGEIIGPGIQGNKYGLECKHFRMFNVFDIKESKRMGLDVIKSVAKALEIETVPILDELFSMDGIISVDVLLEYAKGKSVLNKDIVREGVVIRTHDNEPVSFKVINNDFLLKHEK